MTSKKMLGGVYDRIRRMDDGSFVVRISFKEP